MRLRADHSPEDNVGSTGFMVQKEIDLARSNKAHSVAVVQGEGHRQVGRQELQRMDLAGTGLGRVVGAVGYKIFERWTSGSCSMRSWSLLTGIFGTRLQRSSINTCLTE